MYAYIDIHPTPGSILSCALGHKEPGAAKLLITRSLQNSGQLKYKSQKLFHDTV